jgi:hypothetical protein
VNEHLSQEPEQELEQEQPDPIALLTKRLGMIEAALGVGNSKPNESNLLQRLDKIEQGIFKTERERSLPPVITKTEATSLSFLRKHGIRLIGY